MLAAKEPGIQEAAIKRLRRAEKYMLLAEQVPAGDISVFIPCLTSHPPPCQSQFPCSSPTPRNSFGLVYGRCWRKPASRSSGKPATPPPPSRSPRSTSRPSCFWTRLFRGVTHSSWLQNLPRRYRRPDSSCSRPSTTQPTWPAHARSGPPISCSWVSACGNSSQLSRAPPQGSQLRVHRRSPRSSPRWSHGTHGLLVTRA